MHRRQRVMALAVGVTAAILVAAGIRQADAGTSNQQKYYAVCAEGDFTAQVVTGIDDAPWLDLTRWVAPCERFPFDPTKFAWEVRTYSDASYLHRRKGFREWFDATYFTDRVPLAGQTRAVCIVHGPGVSRRMHCVEVTPPETTGAWTVAPLAADDPQLDVPDTQVMVEPMQKPDPICASCP